MCTTTATAIFGSSAGAKPITQPSIELLFAPICAVPVFAATFTPGISRFGFASVTTASIASVSLFAVSALNAVSITSGGRELPYRETQTLTAADPLLSMREGALRPITVSLYFLDPTSGALRAEKRALALYEGQTRVNALLEALAQGPESDALAALLPEEFTVLSARVEEGTCYLNLPSDADLGISPRQTVESLVLSLCSLDTVERVQIVVDGEIAAQLNGVNVGEPLTP